mmetsp:Transcript_796/g.1468  ORF Transcript_796/g.1468 Transcript_796/m.1468 type:complete len:224 (-) Transcript_796:2235-2906(-)
MESTRGISDIQSENLMKNIYEMDEVMKVQCEESESLSIPKECRDKYVTTEFLIGLNIVDKDCDANNVEIVGSWNNWKPLAMNKLSTNESHNGLSLDLYSVEIPVLVGYHEYYFLFNGNPFISYAHPLISNGLRNCRFVAGKYNSLQDSNQRQIIFDPKLPFVFKYFMKLILNFICGSPADAQNEIYNHEQTLAIENMTQSAAFILRIAILCAFAMVLFSKFAV